MTNKLKYFIGNWKMFGDFTSYKIVNKINQYIYKRKGLKNSKIVLCVPNTLIHPFLNKLKRRVIIWCSKLLSSRRLWIIYWSGKCRNVKKNGSRIYNFGTF